MTDTPFQTRASDRPYAFVLMPFAKNFDDIYIVAIKDAAARTNVRAERLDEQMFGEGMLERIYRQIELADIIIADMSGKNANVFYEVGYAHAKNKLCILITSDATDIPFDLKHRKHVVYGGSIAALRDELVKHLEWAKAEIARGRPSAIRAELRDPQGSLTTHANFAQGSISFVIDLYNDSRISSPEITAIYFYTGLLWTISQNGSRSPSTESDVPSFKYRHFLTPPVFRLHPKGWAQLRFTGERTMGNTRDEEPSGKLLEEYTVSREVLLRIVTTEGTYDYPLKVVATLSVYPF